MQVGTVQAPIAWRPIVQDPSTVALLFSVYERAARDGPGCVRVEGEAVFRENGANKCIG